MSAQFRYNIEGITPDKLVKLWHDGGWELKSERDPERLFQAIKKSDYLIALWDDDRLVGLCSAIDNGMVAYVSWVVIAKDFQGKGWGSSMLTILKNNYLHYNIVLFTRSATDFYVKNGFIKDDVDAMSLDRRWE